MCASSTPRRSGYAVRASRCRPQPEQQLVERRHERRAIAVPEHLHERAASRVRGRRRRRLTLRGAHAATDAADVAAPTRRRAARRHAAPRSRRAARRGSRGAARSGTARSGRATAPSGRARRRARDRRRRARAAPAAPARAPPRKPSRRSGSPGGCVAAIGSTALMPNGRQSSRSKRTGPAATGAAVARRSDGDGVCELAGSVWRLLAGVEAALELEHAVAVGRAPELGGQEALSLGPVPRELAGRGGADAEPVAELELRHDRDPDERRNRCVGPRGSEERRLELGVGALEGDVVPVEAAAALGRRDQEREQHGAEERLLLRRARPGVGAREDRRGGLAQKLVERQERVFASCQLVRARLDERAHERPVLVERRPRALEVLFERERELVALLERAAEEDERAETERSGGRRAAVERGRPRIRLRGGRVSSCLTAWAPVGGAVRVALTTRAHDRPAPPARPARRGDRRFGAGRAEASDACISRRAAATAAPSVSSSTSLTRAQGETRISQSASAIHMFPIPATARWYCSASPSRRSPSRRRRATAAALVELARRGRRARAAAAPPARPRAARSRAPGRSRARPPARGRGGRATAGRRASPRGDRPATGPTCAGGSGRRRRRRSGAGGSCRPPRRSRARGRRSPARRRSAAPAGAATRPRAARRRAPGAAARRARANRLRARRST